MNTAKKVVRSTKNFVVEHKTAVAVIVTTLWLTKIGHDTVQAHDDFLKEHDLYETFYNTEN